MSEHVGGGASRSTEDARGSSEGTDVSLREYLHAEIMAVERRSEARFDAMQRAVDTALEATERRFEGVNEFRATLSDQASHFVTSDTVSALTERLQFSIDRNTEDLQALSKRIDLRQGNLKGQALTKNTGIAVVTVVAVVLGVLIVLANYVSMH